MKQPDRRLQAVYSASTGPDRQRLHRNRKRHCTGSVEDRFFGHFLHDGARPAASTVLVVPLGGVAGEQSRKPCIDLGHAAIEIVERRREREIIARRFG
jgi:hypothetical protein